ncbi:unnamed protein product [Alopecurus aequalis]
MALPCPTQQDIIEAFLADIGFGIDTPPPQQPSVPLWQEPMVVTSPEEGTSSGASGSGTLSAGAVEGDVDGERRLRRRISNRESARRSRARKQQHLDQQRAEVALLRASKRDLAEQLRGARARAALVALANARLRAEGQALGRRLAAARRALALRQLYAAASASAGNAGWDMQTLASLIA